MDGLQVKLYLEDLAADDENTRKNAVEDLSDLKDPAVVPVLIKCLSDQSVSVRECAVEGILNFPNDETFKLICELLNSEDVSVRNYACEILERFGSAVVPNLTFLLTHSNKIDVRKFCIDILARIHNSKPDLRIQLEHIFVNCLNDPNENMKIAAIEAIELQGMKQSVIKIIEHLGQSPWVQMAGIKAIVHLVPDRNDPIFKKLSKMNLCSIASAYLAKNGLKEMVSQGAL